MNFTLTEEQILLRDGASRLFADARGARPTGSPAELCFTLDRWHIYAELGWLAIGLEENAGGWGATSAESVILLEEMGAALAIDPFIIAACLSVRLLSLISGGTATVRKIAAGELIVTTASASDGADCRVESAESSLRISGRVCGVPYAGQAHQAIVPATREGEDVLLILDLKADATHVSDYGLLDGSRAGDIEFRGAAVPPASILVRGSTAKAVLADATDHAIVAQCAHALGSMRTMLTATASYLAGRTQFGQPLGNFQALQHRMAEMFSEYDRFRSITYRAAAKLGSAVAERTAATSAAKFLLGKFAASVGGTMVHLHGAIGMTEALPVGPHYRALLMSAQRFGVGAFHLDRYVRLAGAGLDTHPGI